MRKQIYLFVILLSILFLLACHDKTKKSTISHQDIIVAVKKTPSKKLYFTGSLSPIDTSAVVAHVSGNIISVDFNYGEYITAGKTLFVISSSPLADDYSKAVNDYLQKKEAYSLGKGSFAGTRVLYSAGIISKDQYSNDKASFNAKTLDFYQSQYALERVLHRADVDSKKIEMLSLDDTNKVNTVLQRRFRHIEIKAPSTGIALFPLPDKNKSSDGSASGKLMVGTAVKEGQLLLSIGDLSGLSANFNVSEVDVDSLTKGMQVIVTGSAFPGVQLKGVITSVSAQAAQNAGGESGGVGMYAVSVKIPAINPSIMQKIRVGMSAKFEIDIQSMPHIMLPIRAVHEENGKTMVTILDVTGKEKEVPVIVGETTPTDIAIVSGVNPGDKVVVKND